MTQMDMDFSIDEAPNFAAPWEAKAFALVVLLHSRGLFTWPVWGAVFSAQLARDGEAAGYYQSWLTALESLLEEKKLLAPGDINGSIVNTLASWPNPAHVAHREPIALSPARAGL